MDFKNFGAIVVGAVIMVVIFASVLVPIIGSAVETEKTYKNDGYFLLEKHETEDEFVLTWDTATPDTFTVGDDAVKYTNSSTGSVSIVLGTNFALRVNPDNARLSFYASGNFVNTSAENTTFTLTYSGGTVTATNGATTRNVSNVDELYVIASSGDYTMKKSESIAYLNSGSEIIADSEIYASGITYSGNQNVFWHLEGTIDDLEYPDTFNSNFTITDQAVNGRYSTVCDDLYELNNITFTLTTSSDVVYNVTASYFIVPAKVTADLSQHMNDTEISLVSIIPILVAISIILGLVGILYMRRE